MSIDSGFEEIRGKAADAFILSGFAGAGTVASAIAFVQGGTLGGCLLLVIAAASAIGARHVHRDISNRLLQRLVA